MDKSISKIAEIFIASGLNHGLLAFALYEHNHRIKKDFEIQSQRSVFNVKQIEFQSLNHLLYIGSIPILYLTPGSYSGPHLEQVLVMRVKSYYLIYIKLPFGSWSDQTHIADQDIPKLRQLIQSVFPHDRSPGCNPIVVV